jgi:hypothetical protein
MYIEVVLIYDVQEEVGYFSKTRVRAFLRGANLMLAPISARG